MNRVGSNGLWLRVLEPAPENKATATLVMHHRLRGSANRLLQSATVLSSHLYVPTPELRGHEQSSTSDTHGDFDFALDLHR